MKNKNQHTEEEMSKDTETQTNPEINENTINNETQANETENLKKEIEDLKDKYIRLYSEFENFRRRNAKEKNDLINSAGQEILKSLLPVIDDMERAEKSITETSDPKASVDGFVIILHKFKNILEQHGLKDYNSIGEKFNDELHEAITKITTDDKNNKGKIVDQIEKGYKLRDKVLRYAKVIVGE
ncbi:MAG: nucleotide exchange factor GrpE [Bacteroidetes bacterium]|nr:nucleotide exchange factor GrpE [Bacteroidota bacterium]